MTELITLNLTLEELKMIDKYVELNDQIKALTKDLNVLQEEIREQGTHSTQNYSAIVEFVVRSGVDVDAHRVGHP